MSLTEAELLLGSTNDSPVLVKVLRGNETLEIKVPRAKISDQAYELRDEPGEADLPADNAFRSRPRGRDRKGSGTRPA